MKEVKAVISLFFGVCLLVMSIMPTEVSAKNGLLLNEPAIKVGLWTKQSSVSVSADADFVIKNAADRKVLQKFKANTKVFITVQNKKLKLAGKEIKESNVVVELEKNADDKCIELNRKSYRGVIEIANRSGQGMAVVNWLPIEQYLYSIVPGEMPASWHMEAVKAQAVAARTFALNSMDKHKQEGFDVCASTHCQVYNGKKAELARSTKAVDDTSGLALMYDNKPITAVFHSSSGGYTENSEDVWGSFSPYLRSVKDFDEGMPYYRWEKHIKPEAMQAVLESYGYRLGKLQAIEVSPLHKDGRNESDRTAHGRIKAIRFIGDQANVSLNGTQVRTMFDLKSTLFDLALYVKPDKKIDVPIGMYYKKEIDVAVPPYKEKGLMTDKPNTRRINWRGDEEIVITGYGWGHGLGLSQWGAKAMADKVPETKNTYFKEILNHYYQKCTLKKVY